jgi:hypothetical protein
MKPILMVSLDCAQLPRPDVATAPAPATAAVTNLRRESAVRDVRRLSRCSALFGSFSIFVK